MFLVVLLLACVAGEDFEATTKTYDIPVPGSDPIRVVEAEPLWTSRPDNRALKPPIDHSHVSDERLQHFLTNYADTIRRNNEQNRLESIKLIDNPSDKSKSWDVIPYQKHNHPYDDKKGWVSMEPVPWSISKISKWQSNYKPSPKPWVDYDTDEVPTPKPWPKPSNNYDVYYVDNKPIFPKPTAIYNQKVHVEYPHRYQHKHTDNCNHHQRPFESGDIITDGQPANFPQPYEANRRRGTDLHPDSHPLSGSEGEWVLLSTTKGYKYPQQRQRSLKINPEAIGTHRSVRLTVLPPLKNSKVNMTTSHGGLLQVESTMQTVEEAHKQHKKQKMKKKPQLAKQPMRQIVAPTVTATTKRNTAPDTSAVLAAVGAGMIPATMAMLVPMALGGRRRRDLTHATSTPKYLQVTAPNNLY